MKNLSFLKVIAINYLILLIGMLFIDNRFSSGGNILNYEATMISHTFYIIIILLNLIITIAFIKQKYRYNWQLMITKIVVLTILYFLTFCFIFVTIN